MTMENDLSFIIDMRLALYEQQSTVNPNLPLRFLMYITDIYSAYTKDMNIYGSKKVQIPLPSFVIFYNGVKSQPDRTEFLLSELFHPTTDQPALELKAVMLNINKGHNQELMNVMLAVDVSTSMLAEDLKPNRLEAAKQVASEFINGRPNDNIGLTIFAGESFTQCPLTVDHGVLLNLFNSIKGDIAQRGLIEDGTAIGMGIANAVTRLKDSKAKSKVIILLTDGSNNRGDISPLTAAEIAKQFGIRIYTIGVGTNGTAPYPMQTYAGTQYVNVPVEIDEKTLTEIAGTTNGNYFRATSNSKLKEVYQEIDKLEKTKLNVKEFSKREEEYQVFAWIAFFCILLELLLRNSVLKKIP